jgi:energy-coupling factor transporter transmembrane protein EcfT
VIATAAPVGAAGGISWLHRLSPIPKLAWLGAVVVYAFASFAAVPLGVIVVVGLALAASGGVLPGVLRAMLALAPLAASILALQAINPAACGGVCTPAVQLGPLTVSEQGVARGLLLVVRILAMEVAALLVFQTTRPPDLFAGLARLHVPYVLNFMISLTLQLVPLLEREVRIVVAAQRARGMRGTGFGALVPAFVPVFAGTVERAERLAISLESRGFGASGPRTSYRRVRFGAVDRVLAVAGVVAGVLGVVSALASGGAATPIAVPAPLAVAIFVVAIIVFAGTLVAGVRAVTRA